MGIDILALPRLGLILGVQNFEFQYFLGFQKTDYFRGMKILWIFFWGHHKIGLYLEVISKHFRVFSEGKRTEWRIFFGLLKVQISNLGCLKLLIFFGGEW